MEFGPNLKAIDLLREVLLCLAGDDALLVFACLCVLHDGLGGV